MRHSGQLDLESVRSGPAPESFDCEVNAMPSDLFMTYFGDLLKEQSEEKAKEIAQELAAEQVKMALREKDQAIARAEELERQLKAANSRLVQYGLQPVVPAPPSP